MNSKVCTKCGRCRTRKNIVMPEINYLGLLPDILVLGESPGNDENSVGKPFIGMAGKTLRSVLEQVTDEFILDNSVRCFSEEKPSSDEIILCSEHWKSVVSKRNPKLIVALGSYAAQAVMGESVKITDYVGNISEIEINSTVYPVIFNFHPSFINRISGSKNKADKDKIEKWFDAWDLISETIRNGIPKYPRILKIKTTNEAVRFLQWMKNAGDNFSYDYEAYGDKGALRPDLCGIYKILSIGVGLDGTDSYYNYKGVSFKFDSMTSVAEPRLEKAWTDVLNSGNEYIAQNARYEHKANIKRFGFTTPLRDTMLAMHTLDEVASANLMAIGRFCGIHWSSYKSKMSYVQKKPETADLDTLLTYSALDGAVTLESWSILYKKIVESGLKQVLSMKKAFAMSLAIVEMTGMKINPSVVDGVRSQISSDLAALENKFFSDPNIKKVEKWASANIKSFGKKGEKFNPNSSPQMKHLCVNILKLPLKPKKYKWVGGKRVGGTISTDKTVLEKYEGRFPILKDLGKVRSMRSMFTGFLDKYDQFMGPDGCVHTSYTQEIVVTGRLSSTAPNLQNVPVDSVIRKPFVSRYKDGYLAASDYIQLEPRILAGWSGDPVMCKVINEGLDLHRFVGSKIYGVPYDKVTDEQRHVAKRRNLGSMYDQTVEGLADATGLSLAEAKKIVEIHEKTFIVANQFRASKKREALMYGFVTDLFGARRHLPDAQSSSPMLRERALRQAGNFPIQSTGNNFHLIAMCVLMKYFEDFDIEASIINVEHDKIYTDCSGKHLSKAFKLIDKAMCIHNEMPYWSEMPVKMAVDHKYGRNLYEMEKLK